MVGSKPGGDSAVHTLKWSNEMGPYLHVHASPQEWVQWEINVSPPCHAARMHKQQTDGPSTGRTASFPKCVQHAPLPTTPQTPFENNASDVRRMHQKHQNKGKQAESLNQWLGSSEFTTIWALAIFLWFLLNFTSHSPQRRADTAIQAHS